MPHPHLPSPTGTRTPPQSLSTSPVCGSVWLSCYFRSFVCGSPYPVSFTFCVTVRVCGVTFTLNAECVERKYEALHTWGRDTQRPPHFPPPQFPHTLFRLILYLLSLDSTVVWVTCLDGVDGKGISANGIE